MQICENEMVHVPTGISVHCMRKATITRAPGTIYQMCLCDDCNNGEGLLTQRLYDKITKQNTHNPTLHETKNNKTQINNQKTNENDRPKTLYQYHIFDRIITKLQENKYFKYRKPLSS